MLPRHSLPLARHPPMRSSIFSDELAQVYASTDCILCIPSQQDRASALYEVFQPCAASPIQIIASHDFESSPILPLLNAPPPYILRSRVHPGRLSLLATFVTFRRHQPTAILCNSIHRSCGHILPILVCQLPSSNAHIALPRPIAGLNHQSPFLKACMTFHISPNRSLRTSKSAHKH